MLLLAYLASLKQTKVDDSYETWHQKCLTGDSTSAWQSRMQLLDILTKPGEATPSSVNISISVQDGFVLCQLILRHQICRLQEWEGRVRPIQHGLQNQTKPSLMLQCSSIILRSLDSVYSLSKMCFMFICDNAAAPDGDRSIAWQQKQMGLLIFAASCQQLSWIIVPSCREMEHIAVYLHLLFWNSEQIQGVGKVPPGINNILWRPSWDWYPMPTTQLLEIETPPARQ